jgi:hypothetical protein
VRSNNERWYQQCDTCALYQGPQTLTQGLMNQHDSRVLLSRIIEADDKMRPNQLCWTPVKRSGLVVLHSHDQKEATEAAAIRGRPL